MTLKNWSSNNKRFISIVLRLFTAPHGSELTESSLARHRSNDYEPSSGVLQTKLPKLRYRFVPYQLRLALLAEIIFLMSNPYISWVGQTRWTPLTSNGLLDKNHFRNNEAWRKERKIGSIVLKLLGTFLLTRRLVRHAGVRSLTPWRVLRRELSSSPQDYAA